jgi:transposase
VVTDGFKKFENSSQLFSYEGNTNIIRESVISVGSSTRISKVGKEKLV